MCVNQVLSATRGRINGRDTILVGTNNYLGLTLDPECRDAAIAAIREHGTGTTGSRIANGTYAIHRELEHDIAEFMRRRSALVFPTGYQANLGMLAGLAGPRDVILMDADSHSSIYDGCRLSGATVVRFRHNDPDDLDRRLTRIADQGECKLIVVEGIYSMLGDQPPLAAFAEVKERHGAYLLVDEAHSVGVLGEHGRGAAEAQGVEAAVDFIAGTFSKSLGAVGGFVVSDHPKFDVLRFCCRQYMFTASSCPSSVASVRAAFRRIREEPELRQRLWANAGALYEGLIALGFDVCSGKQPDHRRAPAGRGDGFLGVAPPVGEWRLRQSRAAARHAEWGLPAALQRVGGAHAGRDRRSLSTVRPGSGRAQPARNGPGAARRARMSDSDQRKPPAR